MQHLNSLRRHLVKHNKIINANPEMLHAFIERGSLAVCSGKSLDFSYNYTATLIITEYGGDFDAVIIPIIAWFYKFQGFNATPLEDLITYQIQPLSNHAADISLSVKIIERVLINKTQNGQITTKHLQDKQLHELEPLWLSDFFS